jgi:hypothetical protein
MTCPHGFIGPCAECDGAGQIPETEPEPDVDHTREAEAWGRLARRLIRSALAPDGHPDAHGLPGWRRDEAAYDAARLATHHARHALEVAP